VTAVDLPDNGQDEELVWVQLPADDVAFLRGFDPDRDRTASRADMVRVVEHLQDALASGRAGAGEQQRVQVADRAVRAQFLQVLTDHVEQYERTRRTWGDGWKLVGCICGWRGTVLCNHVADELLALLGGPQPDGEAR
jgi:hypothetical protein